MEDYKMLVHKYEQKQKALKKENITYKKRAPYYIFGLIFFALGLISLSEGKLNDYVENSYNLIIIITIIFILIIILYLIGIYRISQKNKKEIKNLGNKIYKLMKL